MEFNINYLAVLACAVASMAIGFLWYGPLLGKQWAEEMGWKNMSPEQMAEKKKQAGQNYPQAFVGSLLMAYVLAYVVIAFKSVNSVMALQVAFWLWLGFVVPVKYGEKLWGGKSLKLFFIDSMYYLVLLVIMAKILVFWQ